MMSSSEIVTLINALGTGSKEFDIENYRALNEFMKLSESELHILKYFLKLIKLKNS